MGGIFQVRYNTGLTVEDYISRRASWDASPPDCPYHRQGGCRLAPHGTYARKTPAGVRVRRFLCPQTRRTVGLLPDGLAAHLPGTLAQQQKVRQKLQRLAEGEFAERAERAREQAGSAEADQAVERQDAAALIGEAAGWILARDNGQRCYDWRLDEGGHLQYWENAHCAAERRREGHWLLETEETGLSAPEALRAY